ncbi:MAG: DUF6600 domain-containing protein [Burkholderiaceae bacterium]
MPLARLIAISSRALRWLGAACLAGAAGLAWAQADPPDRVAYISLQEGSAVLALDGRGSWTPADVNMPLTSGARLSTDPGSRTELQTGSAALRLDGRSDATLTLLDNQTTQLALTEGTLSASVRSLAAGERFEIDTPNLALVATTSGEYRVDVDPRTGSTRVTVRQGLADVWGDGGQNRRLASPQQWVFDGRSLGVVSQGAAPARDGFDRWVASRDTLLDQSRSARYVSREMPGYAQLDPYGEWQQDPTYGAVWLPSVTVADWAPYRYGRWSWVEPWGWTWVDDAPWGFAPFHYGRWTQIGPRWAWVPGPAHQRPVYAPALVAFIGGSAAGANWGVSVGNSGPGAAWFPLAPGEHWTPFYNASSRYRSRINDGFPPPRPGGPEGNRPPPPPPGSYVFQRRPGAVTVAPRDQFAVGDGRRPRFTDGSRLPAGQLADTRVIAPPPRSAVPGAPAQATGPSGRPPATVLMPRPDAHGMTDPRNTRTGADRQPAPAVGAFPGGNPDSGASRYEQRRPAAPAAAPAQTLPDGRAAVGPGPGTPAPAERERLIRDVRERDAERNRQQAIDALQQRQEQQMQQQRAAQQRQQELQRDQERRFEQLQRTPPQMQPQVQPQMQRQEPRQEQRFQIGAPQQQPQMQPQMQHEMRQERPAVREPQPQQVQRERRRDEREERQQQPRLRNEGFN